MWEVAGRKREDEDGGEWVSLAEAAGRHAGRDCVVQALASEAATPAVAVAAQ